MNEQEEIKALKKILERERKARKETERILEERSLKLYQTNKELSEINASFKIRYRTLVEQANDIIFSVDEEGRCIFVNKAVEKILGYQQDELLGNHYSLIITQEYRDKVVEFYNKQLQELIPSTYYEFKVYAKNGEKVWIGQSVNLIIRNGQIVSTSAVARDITERKSSEEIIRQSEEKYRRIIEDMQLGIMEVDEEGKAVRVYDRFCEMTGFEEADFLGKDPSDVIADPETKRVILSKTEDRKKGKSSVYEVKCIKKNGDPLWLMVSGAPRFDDSGKFVGSMGVHLDITQQKMLQEELEKAKGVAEESSKAKEIFLANMSHEIRTPLNAVLGMTHLLLATETTKEQEEYLEAIRSSSDILLNIISGILDLSKIEAGKLDFHESVFDLYALLKSLEATFSHRLNAKGVKVSLHWSSALSRKVIGDKLFISQIILNILGNAAKFTKKGSIDISVDLLSENSEYTFTVFKIKDTGIGIQKEKLSLIFDNFQQADWSTVREFGGTGLGLSISKHLIELHGGEITASSEIGVGTTFEFTILFKKAKKTDKIKVEEQAVSNTISKNKVNVEQVDREVLNILVAEDNAMNQRFVSKVLESMKCNVIIAENGQIAWEKAKESKYDVILMDIQMPFMDGNEVAKKIRNEDNINENTPIIALTASALVGDRKLALASGMNEYLTKPFSPVQLRNAIEEVISDKTAKVQNKEVLVEGSEINKSPIDEEFLAAYYDGDVEFQLDIFKRFNELFDEEMSKLELYASQNDFKQLYLTSHSLKSNLKMVGLNKHAEMALKVEELSKREVMESKQYLIILANEKDIIKTAVSEKINKLMH
jgi:PAS domain S-box-containing protein